MFEVNLNQFTPLVYTAIDYALHLLIYFPLTFGLYFLLFKNKRFEKERIDPKPHSSRQIKSEIKNSLISMTIFSAIGGIFYFLHYRYGINRMYENPRQYGLTYFFLSPILFIVLHDAYFYWTHRLMHHPKLFKYFHKTHHESYSPTPFTMNSFQWTEALLESMFIPIFVMIIPLHPVPFGLFIAASIALNIVGHLGHELYSQNFFRSFWSEIITTTTHHHLHHQGGPRYNFGFYFRFWDRVCGTEDPRYAVALRKLRGEEAAPAKSGCGIFARPRPENKLAS